MCSKAGATAFATMMTPWKPESSNAHAGRCEGFLRETRAVTPQRAGVSKSIVQARLAHAPQSLERHEIITRRNDREVACIHHGRTLFDRHVDETERVA